MTIQYDISQLPFCCGFMEVGAFEDEENEYGRDTPEEVVTHALEEAQGRPLIFNFVKRRTWNGLFEDYYRCSELRTYVINYPGVVHLHKWINPNTANRIDSYVILKPKDE